MRSAVRDVPAPAASPDRQRRLAAAGVAPVTWLSSLIAVLTVIAAARGLLPGGGAVQTVTSIRGEPVQLSGSGLYRYDTVFIAEGSRGTDLVTLLLAVPLLVVALVADRRGSRRGGLLLAGALTYFLYVYASRALFSAYNPFFLLYIAVFAASLYGLLVVVGALGRTGLGQPLTDRQPRPALAWFLAVCGGVTALVWLVPLVAGLVAGRPPELLDTYTTTVTDVLDLGLIVPTLFVAAGLVRRRATLGYILAAALIVLLVLIGATIVAGTVLQLRAGLSFTPGQVAGPIAGFLVLGAVGVVLLLRLLRDVPA